MDTSTTSAPCWSTSSFSQSGATTDLEMSELGEHLHRCKKQSGRLLIVRCGIDSARQFIAARLVTTMAVVALVSLACLLAL
jgi:hypothetical protein